MKCGLCGNDVRKTSIVVLLHEGNIERKRACNLCVRRGVLITTMPRATSTAPATLDAEERDVREVLRKLARHVRGIAKGMRDVAPRLDNDATFEHADGLEQAASIADAWAARPEARR